RPQIRLERQIYQGMQTAADAVRDAEQQRKRQLTRELRDIIRRKRITTLFQPIVRARDNVVFGYEILTRGPSHSSFRNSDMLFSFARESKLAWALEAIALECALRRLRSAALAPDYLKVTKGLVSTLANEPIKQDLVKMLVELAGKINAKTIAEGIETVEEYETCRDLGIDLLQGYYLAHPQEQLRLGDAEVAQMIGRRQAPAAS